MYLRFIFIVKRVDRKFFFFVCFENINATNLG